MKKNRNAYFRLYYRAKQAEKGLKVKKYKKHLNETEEEKRQRLLEYNRQAQKKYYKKHCEQVKQKRRERYAREILQKDNSQVVDNPVDRKNLTD